jgi:hypothetical protein
LNYYQKTYAETRFYLIIGNRAALGSVMPVAVNSLFHEKNILNKPEDALFLWHRTEGFERNDYAIFRKTFEIDGQADEATLNLFADTTYQLFINGEFIEFGPVRFDPRFPLFDKHDISTHLKHGRWLMLTAWVAKGAYTCATPSYSII